MSEVLDRITSHLVGLRMPRALEALDHTVQQIERGEITALEAIDNLLGEELTIRESRRITVAMATARLTPPKTLEGFDFTFQEWADKPAVEPDRAAGGEQSDDPCAAR